MMRCLPVVLLCFLLVPALVSAQSTSVGTRQGVGLSQLYATGNGFARDFAINQEFNTGYVGGVIVQQMANRTVGFQGGLLYA
ncbi:MAG: hypothetical protein WBG62_02580, partial [Cyclobacteriaceae bacterium]